MSFFENFTEKAKMYANIAAEKARDVAEVAADKAKDVKETAQLTMAIKTEQRELDKNYRAIGQWFASEYEGEILTPSRMWWPPSRPAVPRSTKWKPLWLRSPAGMERVPAITARPLS